MRWPAVSWRRWALFAAPALLLVVVAAIALVTPTFTNVLGLVVVGAAIFTPPLVTGGLCALALVLAALLAPDTELGWLRVLNVALACLLAMVLAIAVQLRLRRLQRARQRESDVLAAIPEGIVVLDDRGIVRRLNDGLTVLVPGARRGSALHPLLGHILADGSTCPGECPLDGHPPQEYTRTPVEGERITRAGREVHIAYTVSPYADTGIVLTMRDVGARVAAQADREVLLDAAARSDEQAHLRQVLGTVGTRAASLEGIDADIWTPSSDGTSGPAGGPITGGLTTLTMLSDERCLVLMVDSLTDGLEAVRDTWKVLYVCRAHIAAGAPLAEMISRAADTLTEDEDSPAATILGVILDPVSGYVQVASGGHPPPLLVHADGRTEFINAAGRALGGHAPGSIRLSNSVLEPGDSLLLYGPGVVAGEGDEVAGSGLLRATATALRTVPIGGLATRIGETVLPSGPARQEAGSLVVLRLS